MTRSRPAHSDPGWGPGLTPARSPRDRRTDERAEGPDVVDDEALLRDIDRGRTVALIAALGRLQVAVEGVGRSQRRELAEQSQAIKRLEEQVAALAAALHRGEG